MAIRDVVRKSEETTFASSRTTRKVLANLVKNSFESNILSEYTSYIALENEAQKAVLKRKQREVLNANSNLDWCKIWSV
jgi:hypothetical protein